MTVTTISKPGLWLIGVLVAVLWGFVITNRLLMRHAHLEAIQTIQAIKSREGVRRSKEPLPHEALGKRAGTV